MKVILLIVLLLDLSSLFLHAQKWSEPVLINHTQSDRYSEYPAFCIDNEGPIHGVWCTNHLIKWDGYDNDGNPCKAGIYLISLSVNGKITQQLKIIKN